MHEAFFFLNSLFIQTPDLSFVCGSWPCHVICVVEQELLVLFLYQIFVFSNCTVISPVLISSHRHPSHMNSSSLTFLGPPLIDFNVPSCAHETLLTLFKLFFFFSTIPAAEVYFYIFVLHHSALKHLALLFLCNNALMCVSGVRSRFQ